MCGVTIDGQDICVPNTIGNALKGIDFDEELTNEVSKGTGSFDGLERGSVLVSGIVDGHGLNSGWRCWLSGWKWMEGGKEDVEL